MSVGCVLHRCATHPAPLAAQAYRAFSIPASGSAQGYHPDSPLTASPFAL
jgi:hypothetical protein